MAVEMYFTWGQGSASVAAGETVTVPVTADIAPSVDKLSALFSPYAAVDSATTSAVIIRGISAGSITVPTGRDIAPQSMMDMATYPAFTLTVTAPVEDESYLNKRGLTHFWENIDSLKQDTLTAGTNISISNGTISSSVPQASSSTLGGVKVGSGLTISSGGVLSATGGGVADSVAWGHITGTLADQTDLDTALDAKANTSDLATVATSGSYNDLSNKPTIPTVNNATLTIQKNSTTIDTFTANASQNKTIDITVPVTASDVSALPASTKYGASFTASINTTTYVMTLTLKDQDGNTLGTAQTIDLPLESVVVNGSYDSTNKKIVLTLQGGGTIDIPVGDLVAGLQSEITSTNKLDSDLVDDTNQTHKFMTSAEKTKLSGIAAGAEVNVQSDWNQTTTTADDYIKNKPQLATVATSGAYSDLSGTPSLATVATSGSYNDLSNKPTIPAAQVNSDWNSTSGVSEILNKPTLSTVATTGAYGDLTGTPNLATVATSGSYNDLSNKPTIPAAQVNSDWNASSGVAQILNKPTIPEIKYTTTGSNRTSIASLILAGNSSSSTPYGYPTFSDGYEQQWSYIRADSFTSSISAAYIGAYIYDSTESWWSGKKEARLALYSDLSGKANTADLATVATSGSYNDLSNKPTIPTVNNATLTVTQNGTSKGTFTANQSTNATIALTDTTYSAGTGINIDANNVISATAVANTFASYSNGTLYITNNATNADTESY